MTDLLDAEARALLNDARAADEPTAADRERIRAAVLLAAAGGAGVTAGAAASVKASGFFATAGAKAGLGLTACALCAGLGAAWMQAETAPASVPVPVVDAPAGAVAAPAVAPTAEIVEADTVDTSTAAAAETQPSEDLATQAAVPEPAPARRPRRIRRAESTPAVSERPAAPEAPDLAAEIATLRAAQRASAEGDHEASLRLLDAHGAHESGAMAAERQAARIVSLCALGRVDEGRQLAAAFLREHRSSPLATRVRSACR